MSDPYDKVYLMITIYEILSPRSNATNYATFKTRAEAENALDTNKISFPDFSGYRIFETLY
jgi:hypothetical protein